MSIYDYIDMISDYDNDYLENDKTIVDDNNLENDKTIVDNDKKNKKKNKSMSWKSILFFIILFGLLLFGYFAYETFTTYIPINWIFRIFFVFGGLLAIFFPFIIKKIKSGYSTEELKLSMIKKYSRRPHYYQNLNKQIL